VYVEIYNTVRSVFFMSKRDRLINMAVKQRRTKSTLSIQFENTNDQQQLRTWISGSRSSYHEHLLDSKSYITDDSERTFRMRFLGLCILVKLFQHFSRNKYNYLQVSKWRWATGSSETTLSICQINNLSQQTIFYLKCEDRCLRDISDFRDRKGCIILKL
jgi:hypothetical protein